MAASIRYHSPNIAIQLITSKELAPKAESKWFDVVTIIHESYYTDDAGRFFPAKLKTGMYSLFHFDKTIYLDVDGCIIKDITPLFDTEAYFATEIQGTYTVDQGPEFKHMKWAKPGMVWQHFNLPATAKLPAINSSYMLIRKSTEAELIFDQAEQLLLSNPLPVEKQWMTWGKPNSKKNNQPDELYFNTACAMLDMQPTHSRPLYFRMIVDRWDSQTLEQLRENWYGVGLFGAYDTNHVSVKEAYEREMRECWEALTGSPAHIKAETLAQHKFVNL